MGSVEIGKSLLYRSGVVIRNELGDPVRSVLGDTLALNYRATEFEFGGTQPDVASCPNLVNNSGNADLSQSTESLRMQAVTDKGFAGWLSVDAEDILINSSIVTPVNDVADLCCIWAVIRASGGVTGSARGLIRLFNSGGSESTQLKMQNGAIACTSTSVLRSGLNVGKAFTDTAEPHVLRLELFDDGLRMAIDGSVATGSAGATGGMKFGTQQVHICQGTTRPDWILYETVVAFNASAAQIAATEQLLADRYGVTLA